MSQILYCAVIRDGIFIASYGEGSPDYEKEIKKLISDNSKKEQVILSQKMYTFIYRQPYIYACVGSQNADSKIQNDFLDILSVRWETSFTQISNKASEHSLDSTLSTNFSDVLEKYFSPENAENAENANSPLEENQDLFLPHISESLEQGDEVSLIKPDEEKKPPEPPKRVDTRYITVLNVISTISVLYIHINDFWDNPDTRYLTKFMFKPGRRWDAANYIQSIFYFAVPIFFMNSGATLIDYRKRYPTSVHIKKRLEKTLLPYLAWSTIWIFSNWSVGLYKETKFDFKFFFEGYFYHRFCGVYWFFLPLFTIYAAIIVFSAVPDELKQAIFAMLITYGFVTLSVFPFLLGFKNIKMNQTLQFPASGQGYMMYSLMGYYINTYGINYVGRISIYCSGIIGLLLHIFGTARRSYEAGTLVMLYKGYMNVPCVLYSVSIFTFMKYVKKGPIFDYVYKACKFFAPYTFGVYLNHYLVLRHVLYNLPIDVTSIYFRTFGVLIVFLFCCGITWILHHIPVLKTITPQ